MAAVLNNPRNPARTWRSHFKPTNTRHLGCKNGANFRLESLKIAFRASQGLVALVHLNGHKLQRTVHRQKFAAHHFGVLQNPLIYIFDEKLTLKTHLDDADQMGLTHLAVKLGSGFANPVIYVACSQQPCDFVSTLLLHLLVQTNVE